jgi:transcription factor MYB, plant
MACDFFYNICFYFYSGVDGSLGDVSDLDSIFASIRDHDITPENMRLFIPNVNWDQLAFMYVSGRSGAECQARYMLNNFLENENLMS